MISIDGLVVVLRAILALIGGDFFWALDAKILISVFVDQSNRNACDSSAPWWRHSLDRGGIICVLYAIGITVWGIGSLALCAWFNFETIKWIIGCMKEMFV